MQETSEGNKPWFLRSRLEHFGGWAGTAAIAIAVHVLTHGNLDENFEFALPVAGGGLAAGGIAFLGSIPSPFMAVRKILVPSARYALKTGGEAAASLKRRLRERAERKTTDTE